MRWFLKFAGSTIGLKIVMAVSGVLLFGFVIAHMLGNLQLYLGADTLNAYGATLQGMGPLLWVARIGLLAIVLTHIVSSIALVRLSHAARPQSYKKLQPRASTYASRTMRISGPIVLAFIIFHILHLTVGAVHPELQHCVTGADGALQCFVHENVVSAFSLTGANVAYKAFSLVFYVVAMVLLGLHLGHGAYSMVRTLGLSNPRYDRIARALATAVTLLIVIGNCSMPIAVAVGLVRSAGGH